MSTPPTTAPEQPRSELDLSIERVIDAPPARVFELWTRRLPDWWGPHGMRTRVTAFDLHAGGAFRTVMRAPDGTEYPTRGIFLEVVPDQRIVFTDAYDPGWRPAPEHFLTAIFSFEALPDGRTKLTARALHKSVEDRVAHEKMGFFPGWGESLDKLAALAADL